MSFHQAPVRDDFARFITLWHPSNGRAVAAGSRRYRVGHVAECLRHSTALLDARVPNHILRQCKVVILLRPQLSKGLLRELGRLKRAGIVCIADYDDLLFTGDAEDYPRVLSHDTTASQFRILQKSYLDALPHFDAFTVATEFLATRLRCLRPDAPVFVVPNGLSSQWVKQGRLLYSRWKPGTTRIIRYLPGSPTHAADFAELQPVLEQFLHEHPEVNLHVRGHLDWNTTRFRQSQICHLPAVPYSHLPKDLASAWLNIAPLRSSDFNRAKSGIKFLEAGAFGCPTIATPIPDMEKHSSGGLMLAATHDQWLDQMTQVLDDSWRVHLGRKAQGYIDAHGMASVGTTNLLAAVRKLIT